MPSVVLKQISPGRERRNKKGRVQLQKQRGKKKRKEKEMEVLKNGIRIERLKNKIEVNGNTGRNKQSEE